jgi:hypothetical protein
MDRKQRNQARSRCLVSHRGAVFHVEIVRERNTFPVIPEPLRDFGTGALYRNPGLGRMIRPCRVRAQAAVVSLLKASGAQRGCRVCSVRCTASLVGMGDSLITVTDVDRRGSKAWVNESARRRRSLPPLCRRLTLNVMNDFDQPQIQIPIQMRIGKRIYVYV